jgi:hypothetical protein
MITARIIPWTRNKRDALGIGSSGATGEDQRPISGQFMNFLMLCFGYNGQTPAKKEVHCSGLIYQGR